LDREEVLAALASSRPNWRRKPSYRIELAVGAIARGEDAAQRIAKVGPCLATARSSSMSWASATRACDLPMDWRGAGSGLPPEPRRKPAGSLFAPPVRVLAVFLRP
jgi:hypothetical protein